MGIIFDEKLCFDNHVEKIRDKCLKRLNIIKIISHKSWKLTERTKTNIYRALIGSIIDYSFFTESCLSDSVLNRLQTIQNRAIRIIYNKPFDHSSDDLVTISGLGRVKDRLSSLKDRYLSFSYDQENIIPGLIEEFKEIKNYYKQVNFSTPLCSYLEKFSEQE